MFDRLVESDSAAQFKPRKSYFMVSTVVVGILFLTAVVISLYAQDIGLENDEFEITTLLAPISPETPEPPRPEPVPAASQTASSRLPVRNVNMLRTDESPTIVPREVSSVPATSLSRPIGRFIINSEGRESGSYGSAGAINVGGTCQAQCSGSDDTPTTAAQSEPIPEPPAKRRIETRKTPVISDGVINGKATHLPPPPYPAPARAVGADGPVNVQVTIDEQGKVISARAISGHALLRAAAQQAAWNARFSPTYLSKITVKVTGIIVYNFVKK